MRESGKRECRRKRDVWIVCRWTLGLFLLVPMACASQNASLREVTECQRDREVVALCGGQLCTIVPEGPGIRSERTPTEGAGLIEPPMAAAPERLGGSGDWEPSGEQEPGITFEFHPPPPEAKFPPHIRALLIEEAKRPHAKHHIFPQEFKTFFTQKEINIHDWVMVLLLEDHQRIHRGENGGPWNADWREWIRVNRRSCTKEDVFRFAGEMIYRYCLNGALTRYYCDRSRPKPLPPANPVPPVSEDD